jgi:hypothetical protein
MKVTEGLKAVVVGIVLLLIVLSISGIVFGDKTLKGFYIEYEYGDYLIKADVDNQLDYTCYKTTDADKALSIWERMNKTLHEPYMSMPLSKRIQLSKRYAMEDK